MSLAKGSIAAPTIASNVQLPIWVAKTCRLVMTRHSELIAFLEGLPEPHIVIDDDYRIIAANTAYRHQFSPENSVLGRRCYEVSHHFDVPCDEAGESCPMARSRSSGHRERVLHLHHSPQGEEHVNIELTPLPNERGRIDLYVEKMEPLPLARSGVSHAGLIGRSPAFLQMLSMVSRVAASNASVLLLGESGTGKELVAHAIHEASPRSAKPLVVVDCASLPETLFESELFGHERGAFTGASQAKPGLVEAANGGTLFLDEVGDIPLVMQVKLLRLLETGTYRRVGSTELRRCDLRIVAATHRDLSQRVQQGLFREDLYYRLCVFPIRVPPLRERTGDLDLLARALLAKVASSRTLKLSPQALALLAQHHFPGNVRELRNLLERCALLCDGDLIDGSHVQLAMSTGADHVVERRGAPSLEDGALTTLTAHTFDTTASADIKTRTDDYLREQFAQHTGSRAELATRLGLSERSLYRKLRRLGLTASSPGRRPSTS